MAWTRSGGSGHPHYPEPFGGSKMNKFSINAIALSIGLAFSAGAMAQSMSKVDYKAGKEKISTEYKTAKAACGSLSGNANDICVADAKGKEKVGMADLEVSYKSDVKTRYKASIARAEATYAVAREKCDDQAGNAKDVCVKEAKSAKVAAKADAKAQMKTTDANVTANEKTAEARSDASKEKAVARKDAAVDKRDAEYKVAKEKCDTYSGSAKDSCLNQAKLNFGK
jgi:hypothetical protein